MNIASREFCVHPTDGFNQSLAFGNVCSPRHEKVPFTIYARDRDGLFPDQAITEYTKAIELSPKLAEAYNNCGVAKAGKGDYTGAIADYTLALQINPDYSTRYSQSRHGAYLRGRLQTGSR